MATENDFSLISVSSDDDDIVIQAGAHTEGEDDAADEVPAVDDGQASAAVEEDVDGQPGEDVGEFEQDELPVLSPEALRLQQELDDAGLKVSDLDDEARAEFAEHVREQQTRAAEQMITTEDDLHAKMPFSGMQRAIVILLLVLVVAFVVYWFVGR